MNTYPGYNKALTDIFALSLGGDTFQEWVDRYEEKYDNIVIDGYTQSPLKENYTWQQLIASTGATPLPTYVDPESPGYEVALRSLSGATGNIPTQKQLYRFNRVIMREKLQLIQALNGTVPPAMAEIFMGLMDESTDGLIKSYHNALAHQADRINSTGKFVIGADNNPRGYQDVTIDFNVPASHFDTLQGTARWFTNADRTTEGTSSDPIGYCQTMVKKIRKTYHYYGALEMRISEELWDDVCNHSKVRSRIAQKKNPLAGTDATLANVAANLDDEEILDIFRKLIKVDKITIRDSVSYVSKPGTAEDGTPDLVTVPVENFDVHNISFMPMGNVGTIQGVRPLCVGYDEDEYALYDGGRLLITERAERATHSIYIESEFAQICVPSNVNQMFICTVSA